MAYYEQKYLYSNIRYKKALITTKVLEAKEQYNLYLIKMA
jgi:hypothetical protein